MHNREQLRNLSSQMAYISLPLIADPNRAVVYSKAAIALHNYLRTTESTVYCPPGFIDVEDSAGNTIDGLWRVDEDPCSGFESLVAIGLYIHVAQLICNIKIIIYLGKLKQKNEKRMQVNW